MISTILINLLPFLIAYRLFNALSAPTNILIKFSFCWLSSQFVLIQLIYLLSCFLSASGYTGVLLISKLFCICLCIAVLILLPRVRNIKFPDLKISLFIVFFVFLAAFITCANLTSKSNAIYTSRIFWDFPIHYPIIQNFIFGDNFPAESFYPSGTPFAYHFNYDLMAAVNASDGYGLAEGFNLTSILSFSTLFLMLGGIVYQYTGSIIFSYCANLLLLTSSSLRFIYLDNIFKDSRFHDMKNLIQVNGLQYNGNMYNIFYFIVERQLIFAEGLLLCVIFMLPKMKNVSALTMLFTGMLLGTSYLWHFYVTFMIGTVLLVAFLFKRKQNYFFLLSGFTAVFCIFSITYSALAHNAQLYKSIVTDMPRFSMNFPFIMGTKPLDLIQFLSMCVFIFGIKPLYFFIGIAWIRMRDKCTAYTLLILCIVFFFLANCLQISPVSIYDNHKWIKPMVLLMDIGAVIGLYAAHVSKKRALRLICWGLSPLLVMGGLAELYPFLNEKATRPILVFPSAETSKIQAFSSPKDNFMTPNAKLILLAGRKVFSYQPDDLSNIVLKSITQLVNDDERFNLSRMIFKFPFNKACPMIKKAGLDTIGFTRKQQNEILFQESSHMPSFLVSPGRIEPIIFISYKNCDI